KVKRSFEAARSQVAQVLGAKPTEIIFTAGATEANNIALFGIAGKYKKTELVATAIEHESVLEPLARLNKLGHKTKLIPVGADGIVNLDKFEKSISDKTSLVSVIYANNEIGTIQPIARISQLLQRIRSGRRRRGVKTPLYLHTDGAQATNYLPLQVSRLGVDLMTLNGSKIYGPKQTGCLYVRSGVELVPYILGGGQERGIRSGTENVAGVIGFAEALKLAARLRLKESRRLQQLRDYTFKQIVDQIEGVYLNGDPKLRLPNNINLAIKGVAGETLVHYLDGSGILVATGSACSANNNRPSHVLKAIGLTSAAVNSSLRITLGRSTTKTGMDYFVKKLAAVVARLRSMGRADKS
ncbi:MAG TPA: cysteine desulfurase family protein, partial [Candidatus Babeliales bacterium]|nr:cysteine desulfurase family protein [Candidatus Babeliales bacterium]